MIGRAALTLILFAAASRPVDGQSSLQFLLRAMDAETAGTADSGIGSTQATFAAFWNPAGIADARSVRARSLYDGSDRENANNEIGIAHHIWIGNTRAYGVGGRFGAGRNAGVGVFAAATDAAGVDPDGPEESDAINFVGGLTYARAVGRLQVGLTAKFVSQHVSTVASRGVAADVGVILDYADRGARLGIAVKHVGRMSESETIPNDLPAVVQFGGAVYPFQIVAVDDGFPLLDLMLSIEVTHGIEQDLTRVHAGASGVLLNTLIARAGYVTDDPLRGPTVGLGLHYDAFNFDYAVVPFSDGFGDPGHLLTLTYGW